MVRRRVVLRPVVGLVRRARPPIIAELSLCAAAPQSVEAHVHRFGGLWHDDVGEDAVCGGIVCLEWSSRLRVAHFDEVVLGFCLTCFVWFSLQVDHDC